MREDRRRPWVGVTGAMSVIHTYLATVLLLIPSIAAMLLSELSWALSSSPSFPAGSHVCAGKVYDKFMNDEP